MALLSEKVSSINKKEALLRLGFPEHDALVYLSLLEKSPCTAGPLVARTGLHRNIVYTALEHLISRNLTQEVSIRGRKHFSLTTPVVLAEEYAAKERIARELAEFVSLRIPKGVQEITVHQGNEEYLALLTGIIKSMPEGSTKYVLGTGGEPFMTYTMLPIWEEYHAVAVPRIRIRMLSYGLQRQAIEPYTKTQGIYDIRYLPAEMENPAGVHIYPSVGTVLNIIYSDRTTSVTAIKIRNQSLAQGYLNLFENLWKSGKK